MCTMFDKNRKNQHSRFVFYYCGQTKVSTKQTKGNYKSSPIVLLLSERVRIPPPPSLNMIRHVTVCIAFVLLSKETCFKPSGCKLINVCNVLFRKQTKKTIRTKRIKRAELRISSLFAYSSRTQNN